MPRVNPARFIIKGTDRFKGDQFPIDIFFPESILQIPRLANKTIPELKRLLQVNLSDMMLPFEIQNNIIKINLKDEGFKSRVFNACGNDSFCFPLTVYDYSGKSKKPGVVKKMAVDKYKNQERSIIYQTSFWFYKKPPNAEALDHEKNVLLKIDQQQDYDCEFSYRSITKHLGLNFSDDAGYVFSEMMYYYMECGFYDGNDLRLENDARSKEHDQFYLANKETALNSVCKVFRKIANYYTGKHKDEADFKEGLLQLLDFSYSLGRLGKLIFQDLCKKYFMDASTKFLLFRFTRVVEEKPTVFYVSVTKDCQLTVLSQEEEAKLDINTAQILEPRYLKSPISRLETKKGVLEESSSKDVDIKKMVEMRLKKLDQEIKATTPNHTVVLEPQHQPHPKKKFEKKIAGLSIPPEKIQEYKRDEVYHQFSGYFKELEELSTRFQVKEEADVYLSLIKNSPKKSLIERWYKGEELKPTLVSTKIIDLSTSKATEINAYLATLTSLLENEKREKSIEKLLKEKGRCENYLAELKILVNQFNQYFTDLKTDAGAVKSLQENNTQKGPSKRVQKTEQHQRALEQRQEAKNREKERIEEQKRVAERKREQKRREQEENQQLMEEMKKIRKTPEQKIPAKERAESAAPSSKNIIKHLKGDNVEFQETRKKFLDYGLRYYIAMKHILVMYKANLSEHKEGNKKEGELLNDITHYSLLYNMTRCLQALKLYKILGGDPSREIDQAEIEDLRNMIIHHGAMESDIDDVLETVEMLSQELPEKFLKIRKPYLMESALTNDQFNELLSTKNLTNDTLYAEKCYSPYISDTALYKTLAEFHENKDNNDIEFHASKKKIEEKIFPKIFSIFNEIKKRWPQLPEEKSLDKFYEFFLPHCQAIKTLLAICGELCDIKKCEENIASAKRIKASLNFKGDDELTQFSEFLLSCRQVRNSIGHDFASKGEDVSLEKIYELCFRAEAFQKKKSSLSEIARRGFKDFESNQHKSFAQPGLSL